MGKRVKTVIVLAVIIVGVLVFVVRPDAGMLAWLWVQSMLQVIGGFLAGLTG